MKVFRPGRVFMLLAILGAIAFAPMVRNFFLSDSLDWLAIGKAAHFPDYFLTNYAGVQGPGSYRPLITLIMSLFYRTFGLHPEGYHIVSIAVHVLSSYAVYVLALLLLPRVGKRAVIATIAALFFLGMPTHSEVVFWIAGYPDLFATFFTLWALVFFVCYRRFHARLWLLFATLAWGAALLSKENAVVVPGIALVLDIYLFYAHDRTRWDLWRKEVYSWLLSSIAVVIMYLLVRYYALGGGMLSYSVSAAQVHVPDMVETFAHMSLTPFLFDHAWRHIVVLWAKAHVLLASFGTLAIIGASVVLAGRFRKGVIALLLCFGIASLPMVPLSFDLFSAEGERFAYFPSVFVVLVLALLLVQVLRSRTSLVVGMVAWLVYAGYFLSFRHVAWRAASTQVQRQVQGILGLLPRTPVSHLLVFGLPEIMDDIAPMLRNGLPQFIALWNPQWQGTIERLPLFTRLHSRTLGSEGYGFAATSTSNGVLFSPVGTTGVYGPATYHSPWIDTELWGYTYAYQYGTQVKVILRPGSSQHEHIRNREAGLFYGTHNGLSEYWPFDPVPPKSAGDNYPVSLPVFIE